MERTDNRQPKNILESILYGMKMINDNVVTLSENLQSAMERITEIYNTLQIGDAHNPASAENENSGSQE